MPSYIKSEHLARMFPFEFYEEISENLKEFTLTNPAFIFRDPARWDINARKRMYEETLHSEITTTLHGNNIIDVDPFGDVLILDICFNDNYESYMNMMLANNYDRSQLPLSVLVAQLYDSSGKAVFASDVSEKTIARIPEVLWDDPNLLLAVVTFSEKETTTGVLKIPKKIEETILEPIETESKTEEIVGVTHA